MQTFSRTGPSHHPEHLHTTHQMTSNRPYAPSQSFQHQQKRPWTQMKSWKKSQWSYPGQRPHLNNQALTQRTRALQKFQCKTCYSITRTSHEGDISRSTERRGQYPTPTHNEHNPPGGSDRIRHGESRTQQGSERLTYGPTPYGATPYGSTAGQIKHELSNCPFGSYFVNIPLLAFTRNSEWNVKCLRHASDFAQQRRHIGP